MNREEEGMESGKWKEEAHGRCIQLGVNLVTLVFESQRSHQGEQDLTVFNNVIMYVILMIMKIHVV